MTLHQMAFVGVAALIVLVLVFELVRRQLLQEDFAWLWMGAGLAAVLLVLSPTMLEILTDLSGSTKATTTVFVLAILFLTIVCLHLSSQLTRQGHRFTAMAQKLALLSARQPEESSVDDE